jgi:hypothetical protein
MIHHKMGTTIFYRSNNRHMCVSKNDPSQNGHGYFLSKQHACTKRVGMIPCLGLLFLLITLPLGRHMWLVSPHDESCIPVNIVVE